MPTRDIDLTEELDQLVTAKVSSGLFADASDVMRAALRALVREQEAHEAKLIALRAALDEGERSGRSQQTLADIWERAERDHVTGHG